MKVSNTVFQCVSHVRVAKMSEIFGSLRHDANDFSNASNFGARKKIQESPGRSDGKASRRLAVKTRKIEEGDPLGSASAPSRTLGEG